MALLSRQQAWQGYSNMSRNRESFIVLNVDRNIVKVSKKKLNAT